MPTELNIGANIEAPKKIETPAGASAERPGLSLEKPETAGEKKPETTGEAEALMAAARKTLPVKSVISEYEKREKQIENFLTRGLEDIYLSLPPERQVEFRRTGEETAQKINKLLEKAKINIGKIVGLIRKWLAMIPGVNKYFLEQEAKIKADEIIKLRNRN